MKVSQRVSALLSGHVIMTDGHDTRTDRQMDGQGNYYRASADFVWRGPNDDYHDHNNIVNKILREFQVNLSLSLSHDDVHKK